MHWRALATSFQPLTEYPEPLITYLERLTATQELITNELIIDPPPKDSN